MKRFAALYAELDAARNEEKALDTEHERLQAERSRGN